MTAARREGLVYGLGALHAAARGDRMMWALHRAALSNGIVPVVPAVTVAEGYRTEARSDRIGELLAGTEVEPFGGEAARRSGEIAARCDTSDLSVVAVVEVAERRNYAVVAQRQAVLRTAASLLGSRARALRGLSRRRPPTRRRPGSRGPALVSGPGSAAPGRSAGGGAAPPRGSARRR